MKNDDLFKEFDVTALLRDNVRTFAEGAQAGIEAERRHWLLYLDDIHAAFRKALGDENFVCPSYLTAALVESQRAVAEHREEVERAEEERRANAYAEKMLRKDQRIRLDGDSTHDLDLVGRCMRAGM